MYRCCYWDIPGWTGMSWGSPSGNRLLHSGILAHQAGNLPAQGTFPGSSRIAAWQPKPYPEWGFFVSLTISAACYGSGLHSALNMDRQGLPFTQSGNWSCGKWLLLASIGGLWPTARVFLCFRSEASRPPKMGSYHHVRCYRRFYDARCVLCPCMPSCPRGCSQGHQTCLPPERGVFGCDLQIELAALGALATA
jgi:hypothetical protein